MLSEKDIPDAITFRLKTLEQRGLIQGNEEGLLKVLLFYKRLGIISRHIKRRIEKQMLHKKALVLPPDFIDTDQRFNFPIRFSKKILEKIHTFENENKQAISLSFEKSGIFGVLREYLKFLNKLNLLSSKKNSKIIYSFLKNYKMMDFLRAKEYTPLRKYVYKTQKICKFKKREFDHFPPNDLYRFAKHKLIRELPQNKRPTLRIPRGMHRKAISTGSNSNAIRFREKQRLLFFKGEYSNSIQNYIKEYIANGALTKYQNDAIIRTLKKCKNVNLLTPKQFNDCLIILGIKNIDF